MQTLKIKFENCYGIKKLEKDFDFSTRKVYSLYAPNGSMKTSFAKTFKDFSSGTETKDHIFLERVTKREIKDEANTELNPSQIFVIEPYNESYRSEKASTLLVNQALRERYEEILKQIEKEKSNLITKLKQLSGLTGRTITVESEMSKTFGNKSFFEILLLIESTILERDDHPFSAIIYSKIFDDKVVAFLNTKDFKRQIKDYIERYNTLIESSKYLKKGFNHSNAAEIQKSLKGNGFFKANHSVNLYNGKTNDTITSEDDFQALISKELELVLNDSEIQKKFNEIDGKLSNAQLKEFREYLFENKEILNELSNLENFKKEIWYSYLVEQKVLLSTVLEEYKKGREEIEQIISVAKSEQTEWDNVIDVFNKRFSVPFKLKLINQDDVILKSESPNLSFEFNDKLQNQSKDVEESSLLNVLSQGERRAFYLLNIIFEVRARKKSGQETIFIVDDIADSFDYKNKYAIVEYLKEISEESNFFQIILTHNFDFHRTVSGRLDMSRQHKLNTIKTANGITLIQERYQNNPFLHWKTNFHSDKAMLLASIPFVRNLAEYTGNEADFLLLTSLLHFKINTSTINVSDIETIFKRNLVDKATLTLPDPNKLIIDLIYEIADIICADASEVVELENKIVLSMAIRLKSECYLVREINDNAFWTSITKNQTYELIKRFKNDFATRANEIALLDQINLMTPENLHLNSFMYEPILDMANDHLKQLYNDTKLILN
jgi:ABC-type Mn2+/Zn2+ transport system ATPase subunit